LDLLAVWRLVDAVFLDCLRVVLVRGRFETLLKSGACNSPPVGDKLWVI
jgi:hypothetical protein